MALTWEIKLIDEIEKKKLINWRKKINSAYIVMNNEYDVIWGLQ